MMRRPLVAVTALALFAACTSGGGGPSPSATVPTAGPSAGAVALPVPVAQFGTLAQVSLLSDATPYAGPATPTTLDGVAVVPSVQKVLQDPTVAGKLAGQGFVIVPSDLRQFHFAYDQAPYEGFPVFVTTDAAYHTWHLVFDKVLRDLEQNVLLPKLENLISGLLPIAQSLEVQLQGTPLEEDASRVVQLLQTAAAQLGIDAGPLGPLAQREAALIEAHGAVERSPITDSMVDYSLFTPRGHYTRNADLTRFFLAMSVLGQSAFCLPGTTDCRGVGPLRMGILASRVLASDAEMADLWRDVYEPTAFLVGLADDYTPFEVAAAAEGVASNWSSDPKAFASDDAVTKVAQALVATRPVQIDPEKASVRIMGVRFVLDSYVLDQLIYPNVGTEQEPRLIPSPLDLAAAFGSQFAYDVQDQAGETAFENYDAQLQRMQAAIADRPAEDWGATVYDSWLHALEPMWLPHGEAFPDFMRTDAWAAKDHQTGFGSYAELKHDTILFTKQAVAEGGGEFPPEQPRNWVEPDPVAFQRLAAAVGLMRQGLAERRLSTGEEDRLMKDAGALFDFLGRIAADELAGRPITAKDNQRLTYVGGWLEGLFWRTSDVTGSGYSEADSDAAIVADIARGGNDVVEVGTGRIDRIYVLVPDDLGSFQVAVGGVYSYYEFAQPASDRLTDEAWRAMLDGGQAPPRPGWESTLLALPLP